MIIGINSMGCFATLNKKIAALKLLKLSQLKRYWLNKENAAGVNSYFQVSPVARCWEFNQLALVVTELQLSSLPAPLLTVWIIIFLTSVCIMLIPASLGCVSHDGLNCDGKHCGNDRSITSAHKQGKCKIKIPGAIGTALLCVSRISYWLLLTICYTGWRSSSSRLTVWSFLCCIRWGDNIRRDIT